MSEEVKSTLTHSEMVEIAYIWLLRNTSCGIALKEINSAACNGEYPDVIGFGGWGHSILIEVKISRSDFLRDKKKSFRQNPAQGMGSQRFYCCPTGLLKKEDLPKDWGLIYVDEKRRAKCVHYPYKGNIGEYESLHEKNLKAEHGVMYSALRRLFIKGYFPAIYDKNYEKLRMNEIIERNKPNLQNEDIKQNTRATD